MSQICIKRKRIRELIIPKEYDMEKIQLGVSVDGIEAEKVGLKKVGDIVLPSGTIGSQSLRNAYGFRYTDKQKPKEYRYVSTNWIHPFGNQNAVNGILFSIADGI